MKIVRYDECAFSVLTWCLMFENQRLRNECLFPMLSSFQQVDSFVPSSFIFMAPGKSADNIDSKAGDCVWCASRSFLAYRRRSEQVLEWNGGPFTLGMMLCRRSRGP